MTRPTAPKMTVEARVDQMPLPMGVLSCPIWTSVRRYGIETTVKSVQKTRIGSDDRQVWTWL